MSLPGSPPWTDATAPIWGHVSGYAWPARCEKPLAFLRAFVDDSASETGDRRLFMAGYLNRTQDWALFADAWAEELAAAPGKIEYLKMSEANNLSGQFDFKAGWDEKKREEKLRGLARVIRYFTPLSFQMSINRKVFYEVLAPVTPRGLANPYFSCCAATLATVADFVGSSQFRGQVEFIFDEQDGVSDDIDMFFRYTKPWLTKNARRVIAGRPLFKSDKDFTPLQAADFLAWHIRREHEQGGLENPLPMANLLRSRDGHLISEIDDALPRILRESGGYVKYNIRYFSEGCLHLVRSGLYHL